jgi:hypothetical protein
MMSKRNTYSKQYCALGPGRTTGSWTGVADRTYETGAHVDARARRARGLFGAPPRGAIDVKVQGMHINIRSRTFGDRAQRRMHTVVMPVREMAARLPSIVLVEELAERAESPELGMLLDALQVNGHPLGQPLADMIKKFTEEVAAMRRANAATGHETDRACVPVDECNG